MVHGTYRWGILLPCVSLAFGLLPDLHIDIHIAPIVPTEGEQLWNQSWG
jgi:hypothetical protein